jgi:AcrR family transcriptional regulator
LRESVKHFILIGMKRSIPQNPKKTGRPLSFDRDAALGQAMLLFWRHGYEATSLSDLRSAMGVTQPSIYTAFGDKKQLFLEAVRRYLSGPVTSRGIIEEAATAREAADGLLRAAAIGFTGVDTPPGCLLASSAISCSAEAADVQAELAGLRRAIEKQLRGKLLRDVQAGELPADTDAEALAALVMAVIQGMSTLARDGASREKLMRIAASVMSAWPGKR